MRIVHGDLYFTGASHISVMSQGKSVGIKFPAAGRLGSDAERC